MEENKYCSTCCETKNSDNFYEGKKACKSCVNLKRRNKYKENDEYRNRVKTQVIKLKTEKTIIRQKEREETQKRLIERIGIDNKLCPYCEEVRPKTGFRHNRQKCIECERMEGRKGFVKGDRVKKVLFQSALFKQNEQIKVKRKTDPIFRFLSTQRSRIYNALIKKQKHTEEYLGCSGKDLNEWLSYNFDEKYSFENHGTFWHIDHVIPISTFNLENSTQQYLCLNWRNTVPLTAKENLSKNNKIIPQQVEEHYKKLLLYHQEKNIDFPQEFIDLFTQHAQIDGNPLKI